MRTVGSRVRGAAAREVFSRLGPRGKIAVVAGVSLLVVLFLLDFFVLKGDLVVSGSVKLLDEEDHLVIPVEEVFEDLYVTIRPGGIRREKYDLRFRLVDPDGEEVISDTDRVKGKKTCGFTFEPFAEGAYRLYVDHDGPIRGSRRTVDVEVFIHDHRLISKLFD